MISNLNKKQEKLDRLIGASHCFDIKKRPLMIGKQKAVLTYIIGYSDPLLTENIVTALQTADENKECDALRILEENLAFASADVTDSVETAAEEVLRGSAIILCEGWEKIIVADARSFSMRAVSEPEKDRSLRGPHIGLNESLIGNLIQIRRYLRTADLSTERFLLGTKIKNEVAILSLKGKADETFLHEIRKKLSSSSLPALSMNQETLANLLFPQKGLSLLNPFPRVRYTERPDVVAAELMEGKVVLLCDNSPSAMILPECVFDFFEEAGDYYFPPITASYLRMVRFLIFLSSIFLIPIWLLATRNMQSIPEHLRFIFAKEGYSVPLFLQFLIIELAIDGLKMASLNTPSVLAGSFSVIGGLLLGEFAVKSGWFVPQTILYSAFTAIANYVPNNYELGYSFKFMRISLILLVDFLGLWGLVGGSIFWLLVLVSTRNIAGKGYLYPLFPFDKKAFSRIFLRHTKGRERQTL